MATTSERTREERLTCCGGAGTACWKKPDLLRSLLGGFVGTVAITMMMYFVAPMMLGQPMDIASMLGSMLGNSWWAGMVLHFVNGTVVFPLLYAFVLYGILPGGTAGKGLAWGAILWFLAQVVVMPMMGAGFFSAGAGGAMAAMSSLLGHLVYGGFLGWIAGRPNLRKVLSWDLPKVRTTPVIEARQ